MKQILLNSKNKQIKEYTLVSDEDYEHLIQFKWHKNKYGYIASMINNNSYILHRYIMIEILGNKNLTRQNFIDHINNNRVDNTRGNLRIVSATDNNRNKVKKENGSSKYYGVWLSYKKWRVKINYNELYLFASYDIEEHAAYQWDLWIDRFNITCSNKNNIIKPTNFIEYIKPIKKNNLPKNIFKTGKKYIFIININNIRYISTVFNTIDKAVKYRDEYLQKQNQNSIIITKIIIQNENNNFIIEILKNKKKFGETIIDEENYNDLIKYKWSLGKNNYISGSINGKKTLLHRYIMNYTGKDYIDHINNNPFDNRKCNLRIVTPKQNAMNKKSGKNSSSNYIGVYFGKKLNKWYSSIKVDNKKIHLGSFDDEIEAAKERDRATIKYYGEYGNLNFHNL